MDERFIIANRTDVGKAREANEDSMVTFDSPNGRVVAVCDGMGGQAAGDVASRLACDIITDILTNNKFESPTEAITRACVAANQGILHRAAQNPELEGMGATCVMAVIKDDAVYYGWVGDSRIYYIADGRITQITRDQSYVQQLVDSGQISAAEAEVHPFKNEITNALGLPSMTPPQLCAVPLSPAPDSVVLLCSDGLSGMVDNDTIRDIVSDSSLSLQKRADKLIDKANANGGQDNITVQLIQFGKSASAGHRRPGLLPAAGSKMMIWGSLALAVVIAGIVIGYFLSDGKSDTGARAEEKTPVEVRDTRKTDSEKNVSPEASPAKEVTVTHKSRQEPARKEARKAVDKTKETFGVEKNRKNTTGTGAKTKEQLVEKPSQQDPGDNSILQEQMRDK